MSATLTATRHRIEHIEHETPVDYWHVQRLTFAELAARLERGLAEGLGAQLNVPLRLVRDRIRFEDLARAPYVPPRPDIHHRNETRVRLADPSVGLAYGRTLAPWTLGISGGVTLPLGATEDNPFDLGRRGLPHRHVQFGSGTVDPLLSAFAARRAGDYGLEATAAARLTLGENAHGYRAGNRLGGGVGVTRAFPAGWTGRLGLEAAREWAERWNGTVETEGNLGRTDLWLAIGAGRGVPGIGLLHALARVPLASHVEGAQVDPAFVLSVGWSR